MTRRRGTASLVASPVLVGAVTVLIAIVAVFIAYNANQGLPFVPTYDLKAELPSGAKLVKGNEVRAGGFRVGVVDNIQPRVKVVEGERRAIAEVDLKLDKVVEPLATDSTLRTRPRSALGLKYIEVVPGKAKRTYTAGDTIPLDRASEPLELEDVFSTFDNETRDDARAATEGYGDVFAGRGQSINTAIESLAPFMRHLSPVMRNLANPETELDQFFLQLGRAAEQVAPVARVQAELFTNMADTFAAMSRDPRALQATIEKSPPTMDAAIRSFRVQRPFLRDFAVLSRRLRPAVRELPRSLPKLSRAFRVGTPILPRTAQLNERLRLATLELEDLFENPNTLLTLKDLTTALSVTRPAAEFVAPYQTVCNFSVYFLHPLGEHWSQTAFDPGGDPAGTSQNQGLKFPNLEQPNAYSTTESSRPVDIPDDPSAHPPEWSGNDAQDAKFAGEPAHRFYEPQTDPAIDAQGNADCQNGQVGYVKGRLAPFTRYSPGTLSDGTPTGGNFQVSLDDFPFLSGGTYKSRELGIDNLRDVP
jgi:virulence factor Mce-like protein